MVAIERWLECHQNLLDGQYDNNWPQHEWIRTGNPEFKSVYQVTPDFGLPVWQGEIEPIILLINADFGMGDTIHFWRFVCQARQRVSKVVLRCDEDFKTLFGEEVLGKNESLPKCDKVIHMMALPHVLGVKKGTISGDPYIVPQKINETELHQYLLKAKFTKIGVCWQGNPFNPRDSVRSVSGLHECVNLSCKPFCLNKIGNVPDGYFNLKSYMTDWNSTAHLIRLLDLVITIDTAIAHLAGALGVNTWLILSDEDLDWRWGKTGESTLWYNSIKIFRRKNGWPELLGRIKSCLDDF